MALEDDGAGGWSSGNSGTWGRAAGGSSGDVMYDVPVVGDADPVIDDVPAVGDADPVNDDVPVDVADDDEPGASGAPLSGISSGTLGNILGLYLCFAFDRLLVFTFSPGHRSSLWRRGRAPPTRG